jgi:uncharacterized cupin superfamily protein
MVLHEHLGHRRGGVVAMTEEARLEETGSGLVPASEGWFVVNVRDAAWRTNEAFGGRCVFEADGRIARAYPDIEARPFPELGFKIAVIAPGKPSTLYHAESGQEDFLVLAGECLAIIEGEERRLRAWDFVHCPPGTAHAFVGAGGGPCVLLMTGARHADGSIVYPESEVARQHGASVELETSSPQEAYASFPHWEPGRLGNRDALPWA